MSSLNFTLVQSRLHWENVQANLASFTGKIKSITAPTHVVVLPEMFTTGFSMRPGQLAETMDGVSVQWMRSISAEKKIILTGSLIIKEEDRYFNRLLWIQPNGSSGSYDKRHLFAYGDEQLYYTPGDKKLIASVNGWEIKLLICYDLRFPVWSRQNINNSEKDLAPEFDVLIYVANWPQRRIQAWKTLLQARAIENQCYVIGVNRVGDDGNGVYHNGCSTVVDPLGEILYQKEDVEDIFTITLNRDLLDHTRQKFPFWKDADRFIINGNE